jgi:hypothetical protein
MALARRATSYPSSIAMPPGETFGPGCSAEHGSVMTTRRPPSGRAFSARWRSGAATIVRTTQAQAAAGTDALLRGAPERIQQPSELVLVEFGPTV